MEFLFHVLERTQLFAFWLSFVLGKGLALLGGKNFAL
jgi:hypothetical protein